MPKPILLVIDDTLEARQEVQILFNQDFEMLEADDGYKGIYLARQQHPQLIILDQLMDGLDGMQVLEELRKELITKNIPVIMRTIEGNKLEFQLSAYQKGVRLVMPKYEDNVKEISKHLELAVLETQVKEFYKFISTWQLKNGEEGTGFFRADIINHVALLGEDRRVFLGDKEFKLYYLMTCKKGGIATRSEIMNYGYEQEKYNASTDAGTINALANELRGKINLDRSHPKYKDYVKAAREAGYRLEEP